MLKYNEDSPKTIIHHSAWITIRQSNESEFMPFIEASLKLAVDDDVRYYQKPQVPYEYWVCIATILGD